MDVEPLAARLKELASVAGFNSWVGDDQRKPAHAAMRKLGYQPTIHGKRAMLAYAAALRALNLPPCPRGGACKAGSAIVRYCPRCLAEHDALRLAEPLKQMRKESCVSASVGRSRRRSMGERLA